MTQPIVAFRNFANAPKNATSCRQVCLKLVMRCNVAGVASRLRVELSGVRIPERATSRLGLRSTWPPVQTVFLWVKRSEYQTDPSFHQVPGVMVGAVYLLIYMVMAWTRKTLSLTCKLCRHISV